MANNSINGKFRELYEEVKDNLTAESKAILNDLYKRGAKSLHEYRNNLLEILNKEYLKIINELSIEHNISVDEIEYWTSSDKWFYYGVAIEKLNESIYDYSSEDEFDQKFEELLEPILNVSDEEFDYWQGVRNFVHGVSDEDDEDDEEFVSDEDDNYPNEVHHKDKCINEIENILPNRFVTVIQSIEKDLKITGQIIDFILEIYPMQA